MCLEHFDNVYVSDDVKISFVYSLVMKLLIRPYLYNTSSSVTRPYHVL